MTFGAARRSNVEMIGPSRRRRVRDVFACGANVPCDGASARLPLLMGSPVPCRDWSSAWTERLGETGRLQRKPDHAGNIHPSHAEQRIISQAGLKTAHA